MKEENYGLQQVKMDSVGIILCRDANRIVVEYAISRAMSPVMVAQYKRLLIPKEGLQRTFEEYLELPQLGCNLTCKKKISASKNGIISTSVKGDNNDIA